MVLILIVGVLLELSVSSGVPVIARGEPRPAIIAFLIATLWEFVHIEWMTHYHHREIHRNATFLEEAPNTDDARQSIVEAIRFEDKDVSKKCSAPAVMRAFLLVLLFVTLGLFASGSYLELVRFTTVREGEDGGCPRSYNLYTVGSVAISELVRHENMSTWAVWTLYVSYIAFVIVIPWCVHAVHVLAFVFGFQSKSLFQLADMAWTFASVEVFLIGLFVVEVSHGNAQICSRLIVISSQFKFENLVASLAGEEGAELFGVESQLSIGFYLLIGYCVCSGFMHYWFSSAVSELYQIEPYHKIDRFWTSLFSCCLESATTEQSASELEMSTTHLGVERARQDAEGVAASSSGEIELVA